MKTKTTSTSRAATMASSAAAALLLVLLGSTSMISTVATDPNGVERLPPPYNLAPPGGGTTGLRSGSSASFEFGKVDVFIDLACPKSAEAWPSLKQVVEDQRHHAQFVFHVLPLSDDPIGFFAAKAVQVILANSGGTYDDVKYFIDWVFRGRDVVFFEGDAEMTLDARELITDWAVSSSSLSFTTFHSAMQDPAFDELVLEDLDDRFVLSVESTPTVLLNGIFMMHLDGYREMLDFEFFLQSSGFPAFDDDSSSRSISSSSGSSGSRSEMWEQMGKELRESYADMVQRQEEQQSQKQQKEDSEEQPYDSHSADKYEWQENASSTAHSAAFSPASTSASSSSSSSSSPFSSVIATSPSWGSFSFYSSGSADSSSAWPGFEQSSSSASSQSSAAAASPSSASPLSWGWPTWPSFMTSLFKGRRDDQSRGGGWGWGVQSDNAPAVSAAALAAKAEAAVAAAAAQVVDTAAAKDPKITTKRGGHDDGIRGRAGLVAAAPAGVRVISGSELEKDAEDWWGEVYSGDDNAGPAATAEEEVSDGPAAVREGEARGGEEELGARSGEGDSNFKTVLADAVAVKQ